MPLVIALAPDLEERLKQEATREGLPPNEYATKVLDEHISQAEIERRESLIAMLQSWIDDAENVDESEALDEEFFRHLEENPVVFREITLPQ